MPGPVALPMILGALSSMRGMGRMQSPEMQYIDPEQQRFQQGLRDQWNAGQGDYGYANDFQKGEQTLAQTLAGRGMSMKSGVGVGGLSELLASVSNNASNRRMNAGMQIAGMNPASYMTQPNNAQAMGMQQMGNAGMMIGAHNSGFFDNLYGANNNNQGQDPNNLYGGGQYGPTQ